MATTRFQRRVRLGGRLRPGRGLRAGSRLRVGPHALAQRMLEGLFYLALLLYLLLLLFLLVLFLILLFIFLLCASRLSTRQAKIDRLPALACCKVAVDACFLSSRIYYAGSGTGPLTRPSSSTDGLSVPDRGASPGDHGRPKGDCSLTTTSVDRKGPPSRPCAELGMHGLNR